MERKYCYENEMEGMYFLDENCCEYKNEKIEPAVYVADVRRGYVQTKAGIYYKGTAIPVCGKANEKAYFILANPEDSGVNVFLNKTLHSNLGDSPVGIRTYLCAIPKGRVECSNDITNSNTYKCNKKSKAKIFSGKDLCIAGGDSNYIFTVKGYETFRGSPNGCMLLAPGKCYIAELNSLIDCKGIKGVCSFAWWEEELERDCKK